MASTKEKMQKAQQLIKEKRYDEARAILRTVDHDKAYEWLDRLDKIAPEKVTTSAKIKTRKSWKRRLAEIGVGALGLLCLCSFIASLGGDNPETPAPTTAALSSETNTLVQNTDTLQPTLEPSATVDTSGTEAFIATIEAANVRISETAASQTQDTNEETSIAISFTQTPILTISPSLTNDPLIFTVEAMQTDVELTLNAPTATRAVFIPTALPEVPLLENWLGQQAGIDVVQIVSVRGQPLLFHAEVIVYPGYNTLEFAEAFRVEAENLASGREIGQVAIIISDGEQAIDYTRNSFDDDWQITRLTFVDPPTPRPNNQVVPTALANNNVVGATNTPLASERNQADADLIELGFRITDGVNFNIERVEVVDGRAAGGERSVLISYRSSASTQEDLAGEWGTIFGVVGGVVREFDIDLDAMAIIVGNRGGDAVAIVTAQMNDVIAFLNGDITAFQLFERLNIQNF